MAFPNKHFGLKMQVQSPNTIAYPKKPISKKFFNQFLTQLIFPIIKNISKFQKNMKGWLLIYAIFIKDLC